VTKAARNRKATGSSASVAGCVRAAASAAMKRRIGVEATN
jgi:hypothetical protein